MGEQGLQEKIKLVPIDLQNRPAWYKEKVYPPNKVMLYLMKTKIFERVLLGISEEVHPLN